MAYNFEPIGKIHSPFTDPSGMPIQAAGANEAAGMVEVFEEFTEGLKDLEDFSHIILLYVFNWAEGYKLSVTPFQDNQPRGLFATRAPRRPNPIGLSIVRLEGIEGNKLQISDLDILDGTPLLDIKPFNPKIDNRSNCMVGWMESKFKKGDQLLSDDRFASSECKKTDQ